MHLWVEQGKLPSPDPDLAADMYHYSRELLADGGYHHYEISNWARDGLSSRHNLAYWQNLPYLGVGPGAHSSLGGFRFWDMDSPRLYIEAVRQWAESKPMALASVAALTEAELEGIGPVGGQEHISPALAATETMFLGLRLLDGLNLDQASARLGPGVDLAAKYRSQIDELLDFGSAGAARPRPPPEQRSLPGRQSGFHPLSGLAPADTSHREAAHRTGAAEKRYVEPWTGWGQLGAAIVLVRSVKRIREPLNKSVTWILNPTRRSCEGRNLCPQRFRFLLPQERRGEGAGV